jgi:glycosyltransferase involved in cell wall biosynthesis
MIKILVISSYDDVFNAVRPEGEIFLGLHRTGEVEVEVMTQGYTEYARLFREAGIKVIDFHPKKKFDNAAVQFIRQTLIEGKHQILHLFNNPAIINGIRAAWHLPVKVVTYRGYTGNINWWDPTNYLTHLNPRIDKITCLADSVKEVLDKNLIFRKPGIPITVNKGHNAAWYADVKTADLREFNFPPNAFKISCVANARRMKGINYLLEAMTLLPAEAPIYLLLIGNGLDTPAHLKIINNTPNRNKVIFAGFRKNALEIVNACDAAISSSIFGEATPKAVLEALFLGKPAIYTSIPGTNGMGINDETARIVPPRNARALADAMLDYWQNPDKCARLGKAGFQHISTHFTTERSVREMLAVYKNLLH